MLDGMIVYDVDCDINILNQLMPTELRNIKGGGLHYVA